MFLGLPLITPSYSVPLDSMNSDSRQTNTVFDLGHECLLSESDFTSRVGLTVWWALGKQTHGPLLNTVNLH